MILDLFLLFLGNLACSLSNLPGPVRWKGLAAQLGIYRLHTAPWGIQLSHVHIRNVVVEVHCCRVRPADQYFPARPHGRPAPLKGIHTRDTTWMTTIPSRLSRIARQSSSPTEARSRAIQLYRDWYRAVQYPPFLPLQH